MSVEANKKLVLEFVDCLMQQDYERLAGILSDTFQWVIPVRAETLKKGGMPLLRTGAFAIERMKANRDLMQGGMKFEVLEWTAEGNRVAVECEGHVVWKNGKVYNNLYHLAFVMRDGKIDKFTEYCDYMYAWETNPLLPNQATKVGASGG
jgi:ketosteroid isomerase-like protein